MPGFAAFISGGQRLNLSRDTRRTRSIRRPEAPFPWAWVAASFCFSAVMVFAWILMEHALWPSLPGEFIGVWTPRDGKQERLRIEFRADQFMVTSRIIKGKPARTEARVRLDGDLLVAFVTDPRTGEVNTVIYEVKSLTPNELILEDAKGTLVVLTRVEK